MAAPLPGTTGPIDFMPIPGDSDDEYDEEDADLAWFNNPAHGIDMLKNRNQVWFSTHRHTLEPSMTYIIDDCRVAAGPFAVDLDLIGLLAGYRSAYVGTTDMRNPHDIDDTIGRCIRQLLMLYRYGQHAKMRVLETRMHAMLKHAGHALPVAACELEPHYDDSQWWRDHRYTINQEAAIELDAMYLYRKKRAELEANKHYAIVNAALFVGPFKHQSQLNAAMESVAVVGDVVYVHAGPVNPTDTDDTYERCARLLLALGRHGMHRQLRAIETRQEIMIERMSGHSNHGRGVLTQKDRP